MSEKLSFEKLFLTGLDFQQKFEYYFLGVNITLLSLSIQIFNSSEIYKYECLMFIVWTLLFTSLLTGFYRLERLQMLIHYDTLRMYKIQYENHTPDSEIVKEFYKKSKEVSENALIAYRIEKWSFIIALLTYLIFKVLNT